MRSISVRVFAPLFYATDAQAKEASPKVFGILDILKSGGWIKYSFVRYSLDDLKNSRFVNGSARGADKVMFLIYNFVKNGSALKMNSSQVEEQKMENHPIKMMRRVMKNFGARANADIFSAIRAISGSLDKKYGSKERLFIFWRDSYLNLTNDEGMTDKNLRKYLMTVFFESDENIIPENLEENN